ncbi:MAG: hypothetical protein AAGL98_05160 [Planctomycetota bacterium]
MWFTPRHTPIGIEISTTSLRAVQLRRAGAAWAVHDQVTLPRTESAASFTSEQARRLVGVLRRRGFAGRRVVVSLPNRDVIRGLFEVEGKDAGDPFLAVARDIERTHHLEPGGYELAAWLPPASGLQRKSAVCVTGCTHDTARRVVGAFAAVGYDAAAIDGRATALGRVVESPGDRLTVALDIEHESAELVLLNDGSVVYQRPLMDAGLDQTHRRLADKGLSPEAAEHGLRTLGLADAQNPQGQMVRDVLLAYVQNLVQEARPALDYAARMYVDYPVGRLAVVGPGAKVPLLDYELRQQLGYDAAPLECAVALTSAVEPDFAVPLGLALHPQEVSWAVA